jgi:pimeloyl-ACP methyl ester carboxylesterase
VHRQVRRQLAGRHRRAGHVGRSAQYLSRSTRGRRHRRAAGAPGVSDFAKLVEKLTQLDTTAFAWPEDEIRRIAAPTMILLGDSDGVRLEHAVELFKLLGGGVMGDLQGMPKSQLAVLPGTAHFVPPGHGLLDRADWLLDLIPPFLDEPMPESG